MTFPTPHVVRHEVFTGTGVDSLGNDVETWAAPVDVSVIGWYSSLVEVLAGYTSRTVSDIDLLVPPGVVVSVRDRVFLPGEDHVYEVVAVEDYNHGFHGWTPGGVVKLKRVQG